MVKDKVGRLYPKLAVELLQIDGEKRHFLKNPAGVRKLCRVCRVSVRAKILKLSSLNLVEQKQTWSTGTTWKVCE